MMSWINYIDISCAIMNLMSVTSSLRLLQIDSTDLGKHLKSDPRCPSAHCLVLDNILKMICWILSEWNCRGRIICVPTLHTWRQRWRRSSQLSCKIRTPYNSRWKRDTYWCHMHCFSSSLVLQMRIATSMLTKGLETCTTIRTRCCARFKASCQHAGGDLQQLEEKQLREGEWWPLCGCMLWVGGSHVTSESFCSIHKRYG